MKLTALLIDSKVKTGTLITNEEYETYMRRMFAALLDGSDPA
jgi:hypothetical protein